MKYIIFFLLLSSSVAAQRIGTTNSLVYVPGKFRLPLDTAGQTAGTVAYKDGGLYFNNGIVWVLLATGSSPISGSSVIYQFEDSTNVPPVSFPAYDTAYYLIGGSPVGAPFAGHPYEIAMYVNEVFDDYIVPDTNDWGFVLTGSAQNTWHQYDGSTWPRRNGFTWNTDGVNPGGGIVGSSTNHNVWFRRNNVNLMVLRGGGVIQMPTYNGTNLGLAQFTSNGTIQRTEPSASSDTTTYKPLGYSSTGVPARMDYWPGSGGSGASGLQANITYDPVLTTNNTITGTGLSYTHNTARYTIGLSDSFRLATTNSASIASLAGINLWAVGTLTGRATLTTMTSSGISIFGSNTGTGDSTGYHFQLSGGRVGTYWLGGTALGAGTLTDSLVSYNTTTKKQSYVSYEAFATWITSSPAANRTFLTPKFPTTDTVVIGPLSSYGNASLTVNGQTQITGSTSIGSPNPSSSAMLTVGNAASTAWTSSINSTLTSSNTSGTTAVIGTNSTSVTNTSASYYGGRFLTNLTSNSLTFTTSPSWVGFLGQVGIGTSQAGSVALTSGIGAEGTIIISTGNVKAITTAGGFRAFLQSIDANPTGKVTDWFGLKADSTNNNFYSGRNRGLWQDGTNATNNIDGLTLFGDPTSGIPSAFVHIAAGTTATSQLRLAAGVAPSSPNDGDLYYVDTNDRLMFRQASTDIEILGVSAVNTVTPTAQNRTLTIKYNGTTYYLTAKTTND